MTVTTPRARVEIRLLVPADWAALREARLAGLAEAPDAFASTLDSELAYSEQAWRDRLGSTAYFGAVQQGGTALAGLAGGFAESAGAAWHLISMWVSPQARGSGLADRLVEAVCGLAREQGGARQIALWVTEGNDRARAFYVRCGFRGTGERQLVRPTDPDLWEERMIRDLR